MKLEFVGTVHLAGTLWVYKIQRSILDDLLRVSVFYYLLLPILEDLVHLSNLGQGTFEQPCLSIPFRWLKLRKKDSKKKWIKECIHT